MYETDHQNQITPNSLTAAVFTSTLTNFANYQFIVLMLPYFFSLDVSACAVSRLT